MTEQDPKDSQSSHNLRHWQVLFHTDPRQTKSYTGPGGFQGTATSPTFTYLQLTEHFGPEGVGWGTEKPEFREIKCQIADSEGRILDSIVVQCIVECWYRDTESSDKCSIWGVGGDRLVKTDRRGTFPDDDAHKKALTDAIGNAFSRLGAGADIRLGLFNSVKYINQTSDAFRRSNSEYLPEQTGSPRPSSNGSASRPSDTTVSKPPPLKIGN